MTASCQESYGKPTQCVVKERHYSANKGPYSQGYGLPSGHAWLWELDHKEGRTPKNWCFWTVVLEKTPESPLDSKEIKPVNLTGDQPWIFTGRTDAEAEVPIFWPSDANRWLIGKVPDAGKDWGQKEKRASDDMNLGKCQDMVRDMEAWRAAVHGVTKSWTWLGNWTTTIVDLQFYVSFRCTAKWFSCTYTHIHTFFILFSYGLL